MVTVSGYGTGFTISGVGGYKYTFDNDIVLDGGVNLGFAMGGASGLGYLAGPLAGGALGGFGLKVGVGYSF